MDSSKIEKIGIHCLTDFLIESEIDPGEISQGDKSVSWDDHLYIYKDNQSRKVTDLRYRIPVQVKSQNAKDISVLEKEFIIFRKLGKKHLKNYLNDNGVMLIRPVFFNKKNYSIYVKELLPLELKELLQSESNTPPIKMRKKENPDNFLKFCDFYNDNRYLQPLVNVNLDISSTKLPSEFSVYVDNREVNYNNPTKRDLSAAKFYWDRDDGLKLPIHDAKWISGNKIKHQIILSGIPFYDYYYIYGDENNYSINIGEKTIYIKPKDNLFEINYTWDKDNRSFSSKIGGCMCIGCFALGNDLILNEGKIPYKLFSIQERLRMVMDSYRHISKLIEDNENSFDDKGSKYKININKYLQTAKHFVDTQIHLLEK